MLKNTIIFLWTVILFAIFIEVDGQYEGDPCTTRSSQPGKCTKVSECISVLSDIRQGNINHEVCGYDAFSQIVCCPSAKPTTAVRTTTTGKPLLVRISTRKCDEYKEFAYNKVYVANLFDTATEKKVSNCAFTSISLIVGGTEAKISEFPHMALIGFENNNTIFWNCGGTLISEQFVLSAAHCFASRDGPPKYVRLGEHDLNRKDEAKSFDLRIIERIPHPEYEYKSQYNDIGLFKLERRVQFNGAVRPACLPEQAAVPTKSAIASGWGAVEWSGDTSNVLLKVVLDIFSQSECEVFFRKDRKLNKGINEVTQVCAGSHREEKDTCQGDSGGPLQIYHHTHECTYTVIGATSFGKGCGTIGIPGVYTRVFSYLDWIEKIVWPGE